MLINLRNAMMAGKRLPYDAEVEYLESTGTQWIDTGVAVNSTLKAVSRFMAVKYVQNQFLWFFGGRGVEVAGNGFNAGCIANGSLTSDYNNRASASTLLSVGVPYDISKDQNICTFSGVTLTNQQGQFSYANTLVIFSLRLTNGSVNVQPHTIRCFNFALYNNGTLVRDFIPVRKKTVGYLYDRVSGKLFGNAGTGDFVVGPDVIDITWVDGEYYAQNGSIGYNAGLARIDDYIAVTGGHSITWKWGDSVLGTCYLIVYNAQKQQIDYWSPNSATGERTINLNATGAFVRYSVGKSFRDTTFFKDNTTGLYAVRNGKILLP